MVPLIPNDDTPARRARPVSGQAVSPASSRTDPADQSICGDGSPACKVGGSTRCEIAMIILISPAAPAAAWVWPMFDLTDPSHSG